MKSEINQEEAINEAVKHIKIADHVLTTTYPIVNEPKILLSAIENLSISIEKMLDLLTKKEEESLTRQSKELIKEVNEIIKEHKESPVEFSKNQDFVICSDEFKKLKKLNEKDVKTLIGKAKLFIVETQTKVGER